MASAKKAQILVIDDDTNLLRVMGVLLERAEYGFHSATNGVEGLALAERVRPDLVVLDMAMPFMKGTEVCRRLRQQTHTSHVPVLMMSNLERIEDKLAGFQAGADDYVTKPVNPKELLARINALLVRSQFRTPQAAKTIAVIGAKGGVGVTTLAVNVAAALVQQEHTVTLAELHAGHGELRLHLKLPAAPNLSKLLALDAESMGRADVERVVQVHPSGLRVLLAPDVVGDDPLSMQHVEMMIDALQPQSDYLIVDLPALLDKPTRRALQESDVILLVTEPESLSALGARRQLRLLKTMKLDGRVLAVGIARVPSGTTMTRIELENELSMGRLESESDSEQRFVVSVGVTAMIPPEPEAFQDSVRQGLPMVTMEPSARSSRAMAELAEKLATSFSVTEGE